MNIIYIQYFITGCPTNASYTDHNQLIIQMVCRYPDEQLAPHVEQTLPFCTFRIYHHVLAKLHVGPHARSHDGLCSIDVYGRACHVARFIPNQVQHCGRQVLLRIQPSPQGHHLCGCLLNLLLPHRDGVLVLHMQTATGCIHSYLVLTKLQRRKLEQKGRFRMIKSQW